MKKIKVAQKGAKMKAKKKSTNPADSYPANKDKRGTPTIGGGEGTRAPFKKGGKIKKMSYKSGGPMKSCKGGC
jgi:hypothetical protein